MNKNKKRLRRLSRKTVNGGLQLSPVPPQIYLSRISATAWCLSASPQGLCLSLAAGNLPRSGASWKRTKTHDSWDNIWGNKPHRSPSNLFLITYEVPKQRWPIQRGLQAPLSLSCSRGWVGGDPGSEVGFNWHFVCGLIMGRWIINYTNFCKKCWSFQGSKARDLSQSKNQPPKTLYNPSLFGTNLFSDSPDVVWFKSTTAANIPDS